MQRDIEASVDGVIGGIAGTATMSAAMVLAERLGLMGEHPPELMVQAALDAAGVRSGRKTRDALAVITHFSFGIVAGVVFAVLHRRLRLPVPVALHGIIFGTLVWGLSYKGWVPWLSVMPPPERDRPRTRPIVMLISHWIFGATLGAVVGLFPVRRLRTGRGRHA